MKKIGFSRESDGKKYASKSGWERSWYGGYSRMIWDHPMLSLPYEIRLYPSGELSREFGYLGAEKVLKMFILYAKKTGLISGLSKKTEVRKGFFGEEKKYERILFDHIGVFNAIMEKNKELAPLFEHCQKGVLDSYAEMEIKEDEPKPKPEEDPSATKGGEDKGDAGDKADEEKDEEKEVQKQTAKKIEDVMSQIKVQEPHNWNKALSKFDKTPIFGQVTPKGRYNFRPEEILNAEHLVKLLDISFDPKSDVVKSLRLGKLDTCKIAEVPAGNLSVYKQIVEEQDTRPFSVCILADMSGSMGGDRIVTQFGVLNSLYLAMREILPEDKLFIYGHTGSCTPVIYPFYTPYEQEYEEKISGYFDIQLEQNYDGPVVETIHKTVRTATDDRIIFLLLSDGQPGGHNYGGDSACEELKQILEKCRRDDFVTVGIGIEYFASPGLYTYSKVVTDLEDMAKDVSGVINQVVRQEFK